MGHFLFTTNHEQKEIDRRFNTKKWPFFFNTKNVRNLEKNDSVIIYEAGVGKHQFIADAKISSVTNTEKIKEINLTDVSLWKKPINIKLIYEKLEIIKNPQCYGVYLAGGIKTLTTKDFTTIMQEHKQKT